MRKEEIGRARTVECGRTKKIRRSEIRKEERDRGRKSEDRRQRTEKGRSGSEGLKQESIMIAEGSKLKVNPMLYALCPMPKPYIINP
jgi:hypothetical protein